MSLALCAYRECHQPSAWLHSPLSVGLCDGHFGDWDEGEVPGWRRVEDVRTPWDDQPLTQEASYPSS